MELRNALKASIPKSEDVRYINLQAKLLAFAAVVREE
jgi:hypothetical protein